MTIAGQSRERMVLVDGLGKRAIYVLLGVAALGLGFLFMAFHLSGLIPGTFQHRLAEAAGHPDWFAFGFLLAAALLHILPALLFRSSLIVLDKGEGSLMLLRKGLLGTRIERQEPLHEIRRAFVHERGDVWRLELELESGQAVAASPMFSNFDGLPALHDLASEVNEFLGAGSDNR